MIVILNMENVRVFVRTISRLHSVDVNSTQGRYFKSRRTPAPGAHNPACSGHVVRCNDESPAIQLVGTRGRLRVPQFRHIHRYFFKTYSVHIVNLFDSSQMRHLSWLVDKLSPLFADFRCPVSGGYNLSTKAAALRLNQSAN